MRTYVTTYRLPGEPPAPPAPPTPAAPPPKPVGWDANKPSSMAALDAARREREAKGRKP
jgi:hypothetical protein